jgi:hypothetical protein
MRTTGEEVCLRMRVGRRRRLLSLLEYSVLPNLPLLVQITIDKQTHPERVWLCDLPREPVVESGSHFSHSPWS